MSYFSKIKNVAAEFGLRIASDTRVRVEAAMRSKGFGNESAYSGLIEKTGKTVQAQNLKSYIDAVALATDPDNPDRSLLQNLYENLMLDNHLRSLIESRILFSQRSPFKLVNEKGEEDKEASKLLERPWHEEMIYWVLFSVHQGTTLLEMYQLTEDGELDQVNEIPQSHFNPKKGIILKSIGDTKGWPYKEGIFTNYYLQIGKDNDLGMLERLAPIVLSKKLGMGSFLDYIEKYGVPPLFITTDREDNTRLQELYNAAQNFKSNQFMVGRGAEKFEVGNISGAGVAPFDTLIERANNEMSKGVLGGSGITDEKSFVGSAEIQFRLAKDRFESDKLRYKYFFNKHIKPRLINLSPVYAVLENLTFEWDNTESLSQKEIIDAVSKLGSMFDMDATELAKMTGLPITAVKKALETQPTPTGGGSEKK